MTLETIAESFAGYRRKVIPPTASDDQVQQLRAAFFGGAYILLMQMMHAFNPDTDDEEGIAALEAVKAECEAFAATGGGTVQAFGVADPAQTYLEVGVVFGAATHQGYVELSIDKYKTQMDLPKAREVVGMLHSAIEAAVTDTLIFKFLTVKIGLPEEAAIAALLDFRELRQGSRSTVYPQ
jgi:hypothetical protein